MLKPNRRRDTAKIISYVRLAIVTGLTVAAGCGGSGVDAEPDACVSQCLDAAVPGTESDAGPDLALDAATSACPSVAGQQATTEVIDGKDNDCDGLTDELEVCAVDGAFLTIAAAIAAANDNDTIEVCPGTYFENLVITKALTLYAPDGPVSTILDARGLGRAIDVVNISGNGLQIDGLNVRNGFSDGSGGAIRCQSAPLQINNSVIDSSQAIEGGGLYTNSCVLHIADSSFAMNAADGSGGGALIVDSTGDINLTRVHDNDARHGGGLAVVGGAIDIATSRFLDNRAALQGGGLWYQGDATIAQSVFAGNTSGWTGGGLYLHQGQPQLISNEVLENSADNDGGGIYLHQSNGAIRDSLFQNNYSGDDGGGIRIFEGSVFVENNIVERNYAEDSGGGIRVSHLPSQFYDNIVVDNVAVGVGGGFDCDNDSSIIVGGTIAGNHAGGSGGGIHAWLFPWFGGLIADVTIANNSAWRGGGIYMQHNFQAIAMRRLRVEGNSAAHGAGIAIRTSVFSLSHSSFHGNVALSEGGALTVGAEGSAFDEPCPCPPTDTTGEVRFMVAHDNAAAEGGSGLWARSPSLSVHSSVFDLNAGTSIFIDEQSVAWQYNDVFPASFSGMSDPTGTDGNISSNPLFVDTSIGDYNLSSGSAGIDTGHPGFLDLDGTRSDMGLYGGLGGTP